MTSFIFSLIIHLGSLLCCFNKLWLLVKVSLKRMKHTFPLRLHRSWNSLWRSVSLITVRDFSNLFWVICNPPFCWFCQFMWIFVRQRLHYFKTLHGLFSRVKYRHYLSLWPPDVFDWVWRPFFEWTVTSIFLWLDCNNYLLIWRLSARGWCIQCCHLIVAALLILEQISVEDGGRYWPVFCDEIGFLLFSCCAFKHEILGITIRWQNLSSLNMSNISRCSVRFRFSLRLVCLAYVALWHDLPVTLLDYRRYWGLFPSRALVLFIRLLTVNFWSWSQLSRALNIVAWNLFILLLICFALGTCRDRYSSQLNWLSWALRDLVWWTNIWLLPALGIFMLPTTHFQFELNLIMHTLNLNAL